MSELSQSTFSGFSYPEIRNMLQEKGIEVSLDVISPHTVKKIEYVKSYVNHWLYVIVNTSNWIFFMDIMSNAGIYENEYLCSSIEVLNVFIGYAKNHPDKKFILCCNDLAQDRFESMSEIFNLYKTRLKKEGINNIDLYMDCMDAINYLPYVDNKFHLRSIRGFQKCVLLYVDPYNFISKQLATSVRHFLKNVYCELILNFYANDYTRNINNVKCIEHREEIRDFVKTYCEIDEQSPKVELVRDVFIKNIEKSTMVKYHYYFTMKNERNAPLYYLMFFTPSLVGLEKVKDATWKVLSHHDEYCSSYKERDADLLNLFNETPEDEAFAVLLEKVIVLLKPYNDRAISYQLLEEICLQNTFAKKGHLIEKIIKPLINKNKLVKMGETSGRNYTGDKYTVKGIN